MGGGRSRIRTQIVGQFRHISAGLQRQATFAGEGHTTKEEEYLTIKALSKIQMYRCRGPSMLPSMAEGGMTRNGRKSKPNGEVERVFQVKSAAATG